MAESSTVSDDVDIEDVSLIDTDIAPPKDDAPGPAADEGKDDAAAAPDDAKADKAPPVPDADDSTAKAPTGEKPAAPDAKADAKADEQEPAAPAEPVKSPEELRAESDARARTEYLNRQRTKQQVGEKLDEAYGPKTKEELVAEGLSEEDARFQALREEMDYKEQRASLAELNAGLQAEAVNVTSDFPIYRPFLAGTEKVDANGVITGEKNPQYDADFTKEVEDAYKIAADLKTDENGIVLSAKVPLYDFYKRMAAIYSRGTSQGTKQGAADMADMMARTEEPGGSSSTGSGDSLEEMEERLGDVVIT